MNEKQKRPFEPDPHGTEGIDEDAKRIDDKGTPSKPKMKTNELVQPELSPDNNEEKPCHGRANWCASSTRCENHMISAGHNLSCEYCNLFVHPECTTEDKDGKTTCTRCAEINTCDNILRSQDVLELNDDTPMNSQSDDMTTTSTATEVAANFSILDESESNISAKSAVEDKNEMIHFLTVTKGINAQSEDKLIHILATIAGVPIGIEELSMNSIDQMVEDIKTTLMQESFNRNSLHSHRYKILANFTGVKLPKAPPNKKVKNKIIKYCFDKLDSVTGKLAQSRASFQEMSKITGTYVPNHSISELNKKKILHLALQKIQSTKMADIKIDRKAFEILTNFKVQYELRANENPIFGEKQWCALGFNCRNPALQAPDRISCHKCQYPVHRFCGEGDPSSKFECFLCMDAKKPPAIILTNNIEIKSPFGGPSDVPQANNTAAATLPRKDTTNTTNRQDMDIEDTHTTPTKITPSAYGTNQSNSTSTDLRNTLYDINTATNATADLTISPRQNNILNFNDFDNDSIDPECMQKTRCDIRLNIRASGRFATSQDVIREARAFLQELRTCDPTVMILPWFTNSTDTSDALSLNKFPTNLKDLNKYFPRLRSQSGNTWGDVYFVHTNDYDHILPLCQNWLDSEGHGMYKKRLQCTTVKCIGWLLFSFRAIDVRALSNNLEDVFNLQAEFRFAGINFDRTPIPNDKQIRALHIWIASDSTFVQTKRAFQALYSSMATSFPLDIKMRLVPMIENLSKKKQMDQVMKLRGRQSSFLQKIDKTSCISWDIANLDSPVGGLPSLRRLIMAARPSSGKGSLFISVDYAYKRNDLVIFSFIPTYAVEARAFAAKVAAHIILKYRANEAVNEYFTPDACLSAEEVEWDEATQQIITKEDKYLDNLINLDDDLWLFDDEDGAQTTNQTVEVSHTPTRIENIYLGNCDDSIGTLRSNATTRTTNNTASSNQEANTGQDNNSDTTSNQTMTNTRRFANMEASVNQWVNASASRSGSTLEPPQTNTASRSPTTSGPTT